MSGTRVWITLLLTVVALVLIGWNMSGFDQQKVPTHVDDNEPTYQSQQTVSFVYNPEGKLHYKLIADDVQNYASKGITWFSKPVMTMFNENIVGVWMVRADRAKLTNDNMLYLYDHVEVDSLAATSQLQRIMTDNAQINLINQDISSDDQVLLYGVGFTSDGMKIRGNLRSETAELIEKVKIYYEIPKKNP